MDENQSPEKMQEQSSGAHAPEERSEWEHCSQEAQSDVDDPDGTPTANAGDDSPRREKGAQSKSKRAGLRLSLSMVAFYLLFGIVLFAICIISIVLGDKGFVPRFGIGCLSTLALLFVPYLLASVVLGVVTSKRGPIKIKGNGIFAGVCIVIALVFVSSSVSIAADPVSCLHAETTAPTCTEPAYCKECGKSVGEPSGHEWKDATCTEPQTCSVCGDTVGDPAGHKPGDDWEVVVEPTCSAEGQESTTCTVCGEKLARRIPVIAHTPGEVVVTKEPSVSHLLNRTSITPGVRETKCAVCGATISSEEFTLTEEEIEANFKGACSEFSYSDVARNPDSYRSNKAVFTGEVVQAMQSGDHYTLRVAKDSDSDCMMYVSYSAPNDAPRILEDDVITLWGTLEGTETYTTIFGASVTIPSFTAQYVQ